MVNQDAISDSSPPDSVASLADDGESGNNNSIVDAEDSGDTSPITPIANGQDFSSQSRSTEEDPLNLNSTNLENFQEPVAPEYSDSINAQSSQDSLAGIQDLLSGEALEPIPDTFQIAKAEPSDTLQDRMNQIKNEELAAATAGLEDVFFQFDSWALTARREAITPTRPWVV